jgi:hypothetical protein
MVFSSAVPGVYFPAVVVPAAGRSAPVDSAGTLSPAGKLSSSSGEVMTVDSTGTWDGFVLLPDGPQALRESARRRPGRKRYFFMFFLRYLIPSSQFF